MGAEVPDGKYCQSQLLSTHYTVQQKHCFLECHALRARVKTQLLKWGHIPVHRGCSMYDYDGTLMT